MAFLLVLNVASLLPLPLFLLYQPLNLYRLRLGLNFGLTLLNLTVREDVYRTLNLFTARPHFRNRLYIFLFRALFFAFFLALFNSLRVAFLYILPPLP